MRLFLLIFFLIYGAMHGYFVWRVHAALPELGRWLFAVAGFCLIMLAAPVVVYLASATGHPRWTGGLGLVCFVWMGILFWFTGLGIAGEAWNLLARGAALVWPAAERAVLRPRLALAASAALVALATVWSLVEAQHIRLVTLEVSLERLPRGSKPLRLVQISDLHLGPYTGAWRLRRILDRVREAQPDLLVSTGDLIDSALEDSRDLAAMLRAVEAPRGKLAVTGNHEFYLGLERSQAFHEAAGFQLLRGQALAVGDLLLVGVDDPAGRMRGEPCFTDEGAVLPPAHYAPEASRPATILLKHQPRVERDSLGRFDLQLSGHTHGGQIFPWHVITRLMYPLGPGLHLLAGGGQIYVSRGAGTWGPPMRLLAPPEVTLIILKPLPG